MYTKDIAYETCFEKEVLCFPEPGPVPPGLGISGHRG